MRRQLHSGANWPRARVLENALHPLSLSSFCSCRRKAQAQTYRGEAVCDNRVVDGGLQHSGAHWTRARAIEHAPLRTRCSQCPLPPSASAPFLLLLQLPPQALAPVHTDASCSHAAVRLAVALQLTAVGAASHSSLSKRPPTHLIYNQSSFNIHSDHIHHRLPPRRRRAALWRTSCHPAHCGLAGRTRHPSKACSAKARSAKSLLGALEVRRVEPMHFANGSNCFQTDNGAEQLLHWLFDALTYR